MELGDRWRPGPNECLNMNPAAAIRQSMVRTGIMGIGRSRDSNETHPICEACEPGLTDLITGGVTGSMQRAASSYIRYMSGDAVRSLPRNASATPRDLRAWKSNPALCSSVSILPGASAVAKQRQVP